MNKLTATLESGGGPAYTNQYGVTVGGPNYLYTFSDGTTVYGFGDLWHGDFPSDKHWDAAVEISAFGPTALREAYRKRYPI